MSFLLNPTPPRLPDPEQAFSFRANAAMLQALRLYFEQLNAVFQALLGRNGGRFIEFPTGSYYAEADQAFAASTPTPVLFPLLINQQAFGRPSPSQIAVSYEGTYSIRAALTVRNQDAAAQPIRVWYRKNAFDFPTSTVLATIAPGSIQSVTVDYLSDLLPTDTFEIMVQVESASVGLYAPPPLGGAPRGASARINANLVSNDSTADSTPAATNVLFRLKKLLIQPPA